jgi:very-short-patch-repair endonuclease
MQHFRSQWERRLGRCESPIESMFLEQFCASAVEHGYGIGSAGKVVGETIVVKPNTWLSRYRVDFLISFDFFGSLLEIVVECDGHEWHERTKRQAARDKSRDRALQSLGYKVFRFTGSEINEAPLRCAMEILDCVMDFQMASLVRAVEEAEAATR